MIEYTVQVYPGGLTYWMLDGKLHREGGPAVTEGDHYSAWYKKGRLHREDGPAAYKKDGSVYYALDGKPLTKEEWERKTAPVKELTVAEISELLGYEVKVVK